QWRDNYVFLTPDKYAFDFVIIMANATAQILLDGLPLSPTDCTVSPGDGRMRLPGEAPPDVVIHRCQLTFPAVMGPPNVRIMPGDQSADGYHTLISDQPVGLMAYGFDAFVSYGYAAGLNLRRLE
ncbi:MAG: hypothetical protein IT379_42385, partial [Deltaproteobacteria bacterium]|nr:hypothetical protein [Deltaproteobacteria bacterium]